jgi:hypothetical protein
MFNLISYTFEMSINMFGIQLSKVLGDLYSINEIGDVLFGQSPLVNAGPKLQINLCSK